MYAKRVNHRSTFYKILSLFLLLLCPPLLFGQTITLAWLTQQPKSYAKDYYIWRFFDQNISAKEADAAFYQIKSVNWKLIHRYAAKTQMPGFAMADRCHRLKATQLPAKSPECSAIAITPYRFSTISKTKQYQLIRQLSNYPELVRWMNIMVAKQPFFALTKSDKETFFALFNHCGREWRKRSLDHPLPPALIALLRNDKRFDQTITLIVTQPDLHALQSSLLGIDDRGLSHQALFFLGLNALRHQRPKLAIHYFQRAYQKAWYRFDKDKALFWLYQASRKPRYLRALLKSFDLNIYTLYAREQYHQPLLPIIVPDLPNTPCPLNIHDPFAWLTTLKEIKKRSKEALKAYAKKFAHQICVGHYAFIIERASNYHLAPFAFPYPHAYHHLTLNQKALLLALGRQESRFIPAAISSSYALGMMQIMPFLVKALAKERHEVYDLDRQLDPAVNIAYAITHLRFLYRHLHHPLLIAYAYNGGIGFTKRMLQRGMFSPDGRYAPWLDMELVPYAESRRYGKKVLANYLIYRHLLGKPIPLAQVIKHLTSKSSKTPSRRGRP